MMLNDNTNTNMDKKVYRIEIQQLHLRKLVKILKEILGQCNGFNDLLVLSDI